MRDRASQQAALAGLGQTGAVGSGFRRAARDAAARGRARAGGGPRGGARAHPRRRGDAGPGRRRATGRACSAACCRWSRAGWRATWAPRARSPRTSGNRFGVIEAHSRRGRPLHGLGRRVPRGVAGVLGAAGERAGHEDLVRDSEAQFRELADTTPALMWMTDAEGDVTFVNEGWRRFTGGTETAGVTFATSAHPDDREETVRLWTEAMSRREDVPLRVPAPARRLGRIPVGARARHAALLGRRVRGLRGHSHGHPRAAHDGGGAARVRGSFRELADTAPAMMWTTGTDGADHVREPGLASLHGHHVPGGDGRELGARRAPRGRRGDAGELGGGARRAARRGRASTG